MTNKPIVGIDISKEWIDVCTNRSGKGERVANNREAIGAWLDRVRPSLVGFEPTGGYERALTEALREREIVFFRIHPNSVIAFRASRGIKAKTDRIDAWLILEYLLDGVNRGQWRPSIAGDDTLRALTARRRQLINALQAERCRLQLAAVASVRTSIEQMIAVLSETLQAIEGALDAAIAANPDAAELHKLEQTIFGIGPRVSASLIAGLPELGLISGKEITALVGYAPFTKRSGKTQYRERTGHGRPDVRLALFNAARAAIRHPSPFRDFYDRLVEKNRRPGKVALTAVSRKILVTANAVARDRKPWNGAFDRTPPQNAVGTPGRPRGEPRAHRAGRVKAKAARSAVPRSDSLDAA
ncbi:MAG: IS110 family transposase [Alphaproteobacteria bacterium]|nr:IS110 family transposase [Alphaproteobacteria bacterium]MBV9964747.1 IS110 family transposase [Alphaproteobacteria bacterium]